MIIFQMVLDLPDLNSVDNIKERKIMAMAKKNTSTKSAETVREIRNNINKEDMSDQIKDSVNARLDARYGWHDKAGSREYRKHHHSHYSSDFGPALYFMGALIAGGINFALTHNWIQAILHGLLSWAYVAFTWMSGMLPK